jgi:hypothetical protein
MGPHVIQDNEIEGSFFPSAVQKRVQPGLRRRQEYISEN